MALTSRASTTPWSKRVLVPFWITQQVFMVLIIAVMIYILSTGGILESLSTSALCFALLDSVLNGTEIFLFARQKLRPTLYLVFQVVKMLFWTISFVTLTAKVLEGTNPPASMALFYTIPGAVANAVICFAFLGTLIYGSVVFHRHRRAKNTRADSTEDEEVGDLNEKIEQSPTTMYGIEGAVGPFFESDSKPVEIVPQELVGVEKQDLRAKELPAEPAAWELSSSHGRRSFPADTAKELPPEPTENREVYELAAVKSIGIGRTGR